MKEDSSSRPTTMKACSCAPRHPFDNALPSGNSMAIVDLIALYQATGESSYLFTELGQQGTRRRVQPVAGPTPGRPAGSVPCRFAALP